jgi:uncharacterized protein (DUF1800 family)
MDNTGAPAASVAAPRNASDGRRSPARTRRRQLMGGAALLGVGAALAALYESRPAVPDVPMPDSVRLGHLLRRAGFGASPDELAAYQKLEVTGATDQILNYESLANPTLDRMTQLFSFDFTNAHDLQRWWLMRMLYTTRPLEERMTLFWHGLLTSARSKVRADMLYVQNQFLRTHALDSFPNILKGISKDPAMMVWLDLQTNRKGHANENFARELMELFSMGVGNYTEQDVRESARSFTGYSLTYHGKQVNNVYNPPDYSFNPRLHDDGPKTFLGRTGNFTGDDIIDIIVAQPAAGEYLCRRLFSWFAYDDPAPPVLQSLTKTYFASNYSVKALVRQILTSPAFYSAKAYRATISSPTDYVVGSLRGLGMITDGNALPNMMPAMGQELFNPPNVAGWPGGANWLNSGTWLTRLNYANSVAASQVAWPKGAASVQGWLHQQTNGNVAAAADLLVTQLLDGRIGPAQHQVLLDYANNAGLPSDERYRGLTYLVLGLPEHHLA